MSSKSKQAPTAEDVKFFGPSDLAIGCVFGGFFTALSLVDYSVMSYALAHRMPQLSVLYLTWKADPPIVGKIMMSLLLILPFEIYRALKEDIWFSLRTLFTGNRDCHLPPKIAMHVVGSAQFLCLCGILSFLFTFLLPLEQSLGKLEAEKMATSPSNAVLVQYYLGMVLINIVMLILPFIRYHYSEQLRQQLQGTGDSTTAASKSKIQ
eukprot:gb/GECG01015610.1/.p1 GENE.gb/GECG01015610.1/~~gb/GECG01015610.1/.p1  ORF type:complete len:208 (+),score=16.77 gb/GECG01015610.1/:1-624(+)